jgi:hypothetical protein
MVKKDHKPTIETMVNTVAILITGTGGQMLVNKDVFGFLLIIFGASLEFFKYWGRKNKYW